MLLFDYFLLFFFFFFFNDTATTEIYTLSLHDALPIPNLAMILSGLCAGWLADRLIGGGMAVTRVRRALLTAGFAGAMAWLLVIPRVGGGYAAVACMSGALACFAFGSSTVLVNS